MTKFFAYTDGTQKVAVNLTLAEKITIDGDAQIQIGRQTHHIPKKHVEALARSLGRTLKPVKRPARRAR